MGFGEISLTKLMLILAIVAVLFGTKKLRNIAEDLGGAIKGFKDAMNKGETEGHGPEDGRPAEQIDQHESGGDSMPPRAETKATQNQRNAS
jgi:sec-independent protein translocase protein TatA